MTGVPEERTRSAAWGSLWMLNSAWGRDVARHLDRASHYDQLLQPASDTWLQSDGPGDVGQGTKCHQRQLTGMDAGLANQVVRGWERHRLGPRSRQAHRQSARPMELVGVAEPALEWTRRTPRHGNIGSAHVLPAGGGRSSSCGRGRRCLQRWSAPAPPHPESSGPSLWPGRRRCPDRCL